MENNYSIEEILNAVDDLQSFKRQKIQKKNFKTVNKLDNQDIPKDALRIIEEAEKSKN